MAKLSTTQLSNLMQGLPSANREKIFDSKARAAMPKQDRIIVDAIESDIGKAKIQHRSHHGVNRSIAIPQAIPQTREESGLVDPSMTLDASQERALKVLNESEHGCLIGAAGTGKTTLVKRHLANHIYGGDGFDPKGVKMLGGSHQLSIAVCAFTGIASQVIKNTLPKWMHPSVMTIHTLLEFAPAGDDAPVELKADGTPMRRSFVPRRNGDNPLEQNLIVIDEASMVGLDLWHMLLNACLPGTKILLIGDLNQLTPVADTPFFPAALDVARNNELGWGLAELTTIHRQKGPGANRIIDTAHAVLNGKRPEFDFELNHKGEVVDAENKPVTEAKANPDWRVINIHVSANTDHAHQQVVGWINRFRGMQVRSEPERQVYDPYNDLILTAGNGWELEQTGALVQQAQINASLSELILPEDESNPVYYIDAGRETRKYTVGDRVMCTKNESHGTKDRVTNGTLGKITGIRANGNWKGDRKRFGTKQDVDRYMNEQLLEFAEGPQGDSEDIMAQFTANFNAGGEFDKEDLDRQASHIIDVEYKSGAKRTYETAAGVASTQLGYAVTTHKAQGSQAETVFIVCHGAVKRQLNREWFYTGITRTQKRLVVFSTSQGMRTAIARQQIFGDGLGNKIDRYIKAVGAAGKFVKLTP